MQLMGTISLGAFFFMLEVKYWKNNFAKSNRCVQSAVYLNLGERE